MPTACSSWLRRACSTPSRAPRWACWWSTTSTASSGSATATSTSCPRSAHSEGDFVGRRVEEVVPNTLMAQVIDSGRPILVDLLTNQAGTFLVSRLPLRDDTGAVIGALGLVLLDHPETTMQPLIDQVQPPAGRARRGTAPTRRAAPAQIHHRQFHRQQRGGAGSQAPGPARRRADRRHGAAAGRNRHRQGTAGAGHPRRRAARGAALRRHQHRRRSGDAARGRVLRRRARRLHRRRPQAARGQVQAGRWRHAVPRRNRRHAACAAGQAAARAAGAARSSRWAATASTTIDVRVIAATSRDLEAMVAAGAASAPTCTTASTCCRSCCRRCASAWTTWRRWPRPCSTTSRGAAGCRCAVCARRARCARRALARQHPRTAQRARAGGVDDRRSGAARRALPTLVPVAAPARRSLARCRRPCAVGRSGQPAVGALRPSRGVRLRAPWRQPSSAAARAAWRCRVPRCIDRLARYPQLGI